MRGTFIAFEGIEGCGKSTQMKLLRDHLAGTGVRVVVTHEPGGTAVGDRIRGILLDATLDGMTEHAEMLLFAASRAQLIREVIRPALAEGTWVLCDRYVYSSLAYQGHARGLGRDLVARANQPATEGLLPDRVVVLDLPPEAALARALARSAPDRIEGEALAFHAAVRAGFVAEAELDPGRFEIIDAEGEAEVVHRRIVHRLAPLLRSEPM
jgi:dTMP kinase